MQGTPGRPRRARVSLGSEPVRIAVALTVALLVSLAAWSLRPMSLVAPIDVVGYPSFANFNFHPIIWGWRILIWVFPFTAAVSYLLVRRFGSTRSSPAETVGRAPEGASRDERRDDPSPDASGLARAVAMLAVPASLVSFAISTLTVDPGGTFTLGGVLAGAAYLVVVVVVTGVAWLVSRRVGAGATTDRALTVTCMWLGVVVGPGVLFVVSQRSVVVTSSGREESWAWLPWWLAAAAVVAGLVTVGRSLRRGQDVVVLERHVRTLLLGAVTTFVVYAQLPGAIGRVEGFDDSQSAVGATLLAHGEMPWRDFIFIHGLYEDALRTTAGFAMFEHTLWGAIAFRYIVLGPLSFVLLYLLAVWASPRSSVLPFGVILLAATNLPLSERWVGIVVGYLLLGEVIRRRSWRWTVLLTSYLFIEAVLVPEASFQVLATAVVLVLSEVSRRRPGTRWRQAFPTVVTFVATGAVWVVLLALVLAATGALRDFVDYFRYFGPGHFESGTLPLELTSQQFDWVVITIIGAAIVAAWFALFQRWARGREFTHLHWVLLACTITSAMYGEKALGRFDTGHTIQTLTVVMPLLVVGTSMLVGQVDWRLRATGHVRRALRQSVACITLVALVVLFPGALAAAEHTPSRTHVSVDGARAPKIGYIEPSQLDLSLLPKIRRVLDAFAGPDGTVFDFTNSPGYFYYLLGRVPATPFVHISMAVTPLAQKALIDELATSRPPLVVFDNTTFGLASWDGPQAEVRHYDVAQYLLDHWTPVLDADGILYMARNDLVDEVTPVPEGLGVPVTGRDLYFFPPDCDWGYSANYVDSQPTGKGLELPVTSEPGFRTQMVGWAYDTVADQPVDQVLIVSGDRVVGHVVTGGSRPDLPPVLGLAGTATSGFSGALVFTGDHSQGVTLYAVAADGKAYVITPPAGYVKPAVLRDGSSRIAVGKPGRLMGWADSLDGGPTSVSRVDLPAGTDLADYQLATVEADGDIGFSQMTLTDRAEATGGAYGDNRRVLFTSLPSAGDDLSVRVGSCLQWHGFEGRTLYLTQDKGRPIQRVVLSGVAD